nr:alpha/beta hydrolase [Mesobacterium pallidum]
MVHGFKYRPGLAGRCPHEHILAARPRTHRRACSWPEALGFGAGQSDEGLALAFGWPAQGTIWGAYGRAAGAGAQLARLIRQVRRMAPRRPVHAIAHSLGVRVVLQSLPHLAPGDLGRLIGLNPAEYHGAAQEALETPAGRRAEMLTVWGPENLVYDLAFQASVRPAQRRDRALGLHPLQGSAHHLLRLDCPETATHLARLGHDITAPRRLACHWQPYLRPGLWPLYSALLREPERTPLSAFAPVSQHRDSSPAVTLVEST